MHMLKKILLAFATCFWIQFAFSQSMSDEQVVRYVMEQQEKGKDQQYIVNQLLQKGVTVDQLRRIRSKYEAQQNQPGALDLTGSQQKTSTNRLRTNKEKALDERQKQNGYMIRSQRELDDSQNKTIKNQQLNEVMEVLDELREKRKNLRGKVRVLEEEEVPRLTDELERITLELALA